jgi:hypothetical protein
MGLDQDDIKALIAILQKGLADNDESAPVAKTKKAIKSKPKKKDSKPERENKFLDMPEMHMFKSDIEIDQKLNRLPPSPRNRQFIPINVQCRVCGKKDQISPDLIETTERYKCNKCSTGAG